MKKIAIVTINQPSLNSAKNLLRYLDLNNNDSYVKIFNKELNNNNFIKYEKLDNILNDLWKYDVIIFFIATGIVVRKIAPFLKSKATDPAVIVMSLDLKHILPLLSGHLGGANEFANELSSKIEGASAFITTATDQTKTFAFDIFAKENSYKINNLNKLAQISNSLINKKPIQILTYESVIKKIKNHNYYDEKLSVFLTPKEWLKVDKIKPLVIISPFKHNNTLHLEINKLSIGLGMNRNTPLNEIEEAFNSFLFEHNLEFSQINYISSFKAKADEKGLLEFAKKYNFKLKFFDENEINSLTHNFSPSMAKKFFNIKGVAEPSAILNSNEKELFLKKHIYGQVTIACAF